MTSPTAVANASEIENASLSQTQSKSRIHTVDALRGFALIGVGLVHILEQQYAGALSAELQAVTMATLPDKIIAGFNFMFLMGKFYLIFSFLFGLSFFIQIDKPMQKGQAFVGRFAWRLVLLFGFGYLHHFYYRGDILMTYAVLGFLMLAAAKLPTRVLIAIAVILFLGLGRAISFALFGGAIESMGPESPESLAYYEVVTTGSFLDVAAFNNLGAFENLIFFQFGIIGRGYVTFGLFLLGICLGRSGFFQNLHEYRPKIKRTMLWSIPAAIVSALATMGVFSLVQQPPTLNSWLEVLALTFYDCFNLSIGLLFSCAFLMFATGKRSQGIISTFAPYGRMALSNYMLQSLIGAFIFYGWGLALLGQWPNSYILPLGITVAIAQIILSIVWMKNFQYGPLEWVWRTATLRQRVPLLK